MSVFDYRATKDGVRAAGEDEAQLAMARATGNFKRGNER